MNRFRLSETYKDWLPAQGVSECSLSQAPKLFHDAMCFYSKESVFTKSQPLGRLLLLLRVVTLH